jgi:hypothetical protein
MFIQVGLKYTVLKLMPRCCDMRSGVSATALPRGAWALGEYALSRFHLRAKDEQNSHHMY